MSANDGDKVLFIFSLLSSFSFEIFFPIFRVNFIITYSKDNFTHILLLFGKLSVAEEITEKNGCSCFCPHAVYKTRLLLFIHGFHSSPPQIFPSAS